MQEHMSNGKHVSPRTSKPGTEPFNLRVCREFLAAYWRADLAHALQWCSPDSMIDLARSLPIRTPAPVSVVLPLMFRDIYVRFENQRFDSEIVGAIADEDRVLVEYVARGKLATGCPFECGYAVVFDFVKGQIAKIRAYADTRYVSAALIS
jgi:ketosteroid isomerase-like protein